jgi:hypothetical protein
MPGSWHGLRAPGEERAGLSAALDEWSAGQSARPLPVDSATKCFVGSVQLGTGEWPGTERHRLLRSARWSYPLCRAILGGVALTVMVAAAAQGTMVRLALRRPGFGSAGAGETIHVELRRTPLQQGPATAGISTAASSQQPAPLQSATTTMTTIATTSASSTATTTYTAGSLASRPAGTYPALPPPVSSEVARLEGVVSALATQPGGLTARAEDAAVALEALAEAHSAGGAGSEAEDCRRAAAELRRLVRATCVISLSLLPATCLSAPSDLNTPAACCHNPFSVPFRLLLLYQWFLSILSRLCCNISD